jgi:formylglycine-generating enzyme required for sulfatase activity
VVCQTGTNVGDDYMQCESAIYNGIMNGAWTLNGVDTVYECTGYRLPTEAEREYATRADTTTAFYDGPITEVDCSPVDPNLNTIGWYCGNDNEHVRPVGEKLPNAWSLYDMSGDVWEWVWDGYATYDAGPDTDPVVDPAVGAAHVLRGGCWDCAASGCRSAYRSHDPALGYRAGYVGFRVVKTAPAP